MFKKLALVAAVVGSVSATAGAQTVVDPKCSLWIGSYTACTGSYSPYNIPDSGINAVNWDAFLSAASTVWYAPGSPTGAASDKGTFTYAGKSDVFPGPFVSNATGSSGNLDFVGTVTGPFILGLKSGTSVSFYYFASGSYGDIDFNTMGTAVNGNGVAQGLSHAGLYLGDGATITSVPEPTTYALMATGLLGIFGFARRRRNNA
jgi:PEP-CTERM motif